MIRLYLFFIVFILNFPVFASGKFQCFLISSKGINLDAHIVEKLNIISEELFLKKIEKTIKDAPRNLKAEIVEQVKNLFVFDNNDLPLVVMLPSKSKRGKYYVGINKVFFELNSKDLLVKFLFPYLKIKKEDLHVKISDTTGFKSNLLFGSLFGFKQLVLNESGIGNIEKMYHLGEVGKSFDWIRFNSEGNYALLPSKTKSFIDKFARKLIDNGILEQSKARLVPTKEILDMTSDVPRALGALTLRGVASKWLNLIETYAMYFVEVSGNAKITVKYKSKNIYSSCWEDKKCTLHRHWMDAENENTKIHLPIRRKYLENCF